MKNLDYVVEPVISKFWFCKPKIKWAVFMCWDGWYDPTYGNGGGDVVKIKKSIYKFPTREEAYNFVSIVKGER